MSKEIFPTASKEQTPSNASMERSRQDRPKAIIFDVRDGSLWRELDAKFFPGAVLSCVLYGSLSADILRYVF